MDTREETTEEMITKIYLIVSDIQYALCRMSAMIEKSPFQTDLPGFHDAAEPPKPKSRYVLIYEGLYSIYGCRFVDREELRTSDEVLKVLEEASKATYGKPIGRGTIPWILSRFSKAGAMEGGRSKTIRFREPTDEIRNEIDRLNKEAAK